MRRGCRRQIDTFWAKGSLAWILPTGPSTSAIAPAVATAAPIRSMTIGCALAASEKTFCVFASIVTYFVATILVRMDQFQSVAESFTFGIAPLMARWLRARTIWIHARMVFVPRGVVPTSPIETLTIDQLSTLRHCRKRSASLLIIRVLPTVEVVHN